ncbi:class I SAM-dependent methyltransferase [Marinoscillum furvescens]|uniref:Methyltransferase family protein n=1 Tax=Marinoscillum furvescens DSM 4134 TaxID=1122208 RepID=A0A3D9L6V3_MARFU|nr:class I SAM-dependent methyltransferase [Marinoscillum furvescens]REE02045.1 methyltransferase family protein [Marinoscillum furvescens DSM 4134]
MKRSWNEHVELFNGKSTPPAATLTKALELLKSQTENTSKRAIDLGCGSGSDTMALIQQGWQVLAIDQEAKIIQHLVQQLPAPLPSLTTRCTTFEALETLPPADLINASFSLPFCNPAHFDQLWDTITSSLVQGGYFAGHFFGPEDDWAPNPSMIFHDTMAIEQLFRGFRIAAHKEVNKTGKTISGDSKHWHVHHLVACKL